MTEASYRDTDKQKRRMLRFEEPFQKKKKFGRKKAEITPQRPELPGHVGGPPSGRVDRSAEEALGLVQRDCGQHGWARSGSGGEPMQGTQELQQSGFRGKADDKLHVCAWLRQ